MIKKLGSFRKPSDTNEIINVLENLQKAYLYQIKTKNTGRTAPETHRILNKMRRLMVEYETAILTHMNSDCNNEDCVYCESRYPEMKNLDVDELYKHYTNQYAEI